jgi:hypothetical protein
VPSFFIMSSFLCILHTKEAHNAEVCPSGHLPSSFIFEVNWRNRTRLAVEVVQIKFFYLSTVNCECKWSCLCSIDGTNSGNLLRTKHLGVLNRGNFFASMCLEHSFVWYWNVDISESRSEIPGKFWNVVLEKNGDQLNRSFEKWRNITQSPGGEEYPTYNKKKKG